jgi:photosystem II stability/assembly factor-like uncharacterized protein
VGESEVPVNRGYLRDATRWTSGVAVLVALCAAVLLAVSAVAPSPGAAPPHGSVRIIDNLYGTRFINAEEGWAVGAFGTIFHTSDGGQTWRPEVSHSMEQLFSVDFADSQHGWVVGRTGIILHTSDGGETWVQQPTGVERHLFKVTALDPQRAWAVGDWGTILVTEDGGRTWKDRTLSRDVILNGMSWPDRAHGWIVGEAGTILATSNGGIDWSDQTSGIQKTLFGVYFVDAQHGWAVGLDGLILRTTDGGQTWQVQHGDPEVGALEQVGFREALDNPSLYDIVMAGREGYAVGDNGSVFASDDAGETWHRKDVPGQASLQWLRAASLVNGTHGVLVGANGLTIRVVGDQLHVSENEDNAPETPD